MDTQTTDTSKPAQIAKHLGYLDGLRAVAALYVVMHHASSQIENANPSKITKLVAYPFQYGHFAVDLFIVLSGFCLMLPIVRGNGMLRGGALEFYKRRAWRILPPYYLSIVFSLLLIFALSINHKTGTHWDVSVPVTGKGLLVHLLMIQDAFTGPSNSNINHVLWSVAVEWRIYFLFPLIVLAWRRFGAFSTTIAALVISAVLYFLCEFAIGSSLSAHYIGLFVVGVLASAVAFSPEKVMMDLRKLPWGIITIVLFLALQGFMHVKVWHGAIAPAFITDYVMGFLSMALLITVSLNKNNLLTKCLSWNPLVIVGSFAYSIYLIHAPLLQVLWQYPFARLQSNPLAMLLALIFVGTPVIVGVAYLFFLACEAPFMRSKKKESPEALAGEAIIKPAP